MDEESNFKPIDKLWMERDDLFVIFVEFKLSNKEYDEAMSCINKKLSLCKDFSSKKPIMESLKPVHQRLYDNRKGDACCVLEEAAEVILGDDYFFALQDY